MNTWIPDGYIRFERRFKKFYCAQVLQGKKRRILRAEFKTATEAQP